jgi:hypothetical protein
MTTTTPRADSGKDFKAVQDAIFNYMDHITDQLLAEPDTTMSQCTQAACDIVEYRVQVAYNCAAGKLMKGLGRGH